MSLEAYGDEGNVGCEGCAELEARSEELEEQLASALAELEQLKTKLASHCEMLHGEGPCE